MNEQLSLFNLKKPAQQQPTLRYNGVDYDPEKDDIRLTKQLARIVAYMADGRWASLAEIAAATGDPEASISAQLRHLRKKRFGGHTVTRRNWGGGLFKYQLILRLDP